MSPDHSIAMLDRQIEKHGQTISLRRGKVAPFEIEATIKAFVRKMPSENLTDGVKQVRRSVVLSPTDLSAWSPLPRAGDYASIADVAGGQFLKIDEPPEVIRLNDVLVRINLVVLG